jgi:hypothetical protein
MTINYTNILNSKALQNLSEFGFIGLKIYHLATLAQTTYVHAYRRTERKRKANHRRMFWTAAEELLLATKIHTFSTKSHFRGG